MLATSREALCVPGEQTLPILPLPLPRGGDGVEALSRSTAVRLFVERARGHKPSFALNEREAPAVAELVTRLEGIPLAIELAAARVRSLSVGDINARLKDRYKLLTGGGRVLLERQQTLRALVDWSYDLLSEAERTVLNRLSVFIGGFDLPAAEAVCGADPLTSDEVLDLIGSLVAKSLLMMEDRVEGTRYRMLETIRDYAHERLDASGESAAVAASHCMHYFALAKAANHGVKGPDQADWLQRIEIDLDNVRAATALALEGGVDPIISVKIAVAMQGFWILRGYCSEGRQVVRSALALADVKASDVAQAHGLYVDAALAESQSDYAKARSVLQTCLKLRRQLGNQADVAATLSTLAIAQLPMGDATAARENEQEALAIFRQIGDRQGEAIVLLHLGQVAQYVDEEAEAQSHVQASLAIARQIRYREVEGECELVLGELAFETADQTRARQHLERSLAICQEAADKRGEANALWWLGKVDLHDHVLPSARTRLGAAMRAFRSFEMRKELLGCLEDHASLLLAEGLTEIAVRLAAAAGLLRQQFNLMHSPREDRRWQAQLGALRNATTSDSFDAACHAVRAWQIDDAVRTSMSEPEPGRIARDRNARSV